MALPAFPVERRLQAYASCRSISAAGARAQQQTRRPPLLLSTDGTNRRTDTRPLRRACSAYYEGNIHITVAEH